MYSFGDQWLVINQVVVKIGKTRFQIAVYWWHFVTPQKMAPAEMGMALVFAPAKIYGFERIQTWPPAVNSGLGNTNQIPSGNLT